MVNPPLRRTAARDVLLPPAAVYRAWTGQFDRWFAAPVTVTHEGFGDEDARARHAEPWPSLLEHLENRLAE